VRLQDYDDLWNARQLAELHGEELRYVPGVGWYGWDGCRWATGATADAFVNRCVYSLVDSYRERAAELARAGKREECNDLLKWAKTSSLYSHLRDVPNIARNLQPFYAEVDDFDAQTFLFNAANCAVDLRDGFMRPHAPHDFLTHVSLTDYDPRATCPTWLRFLDAVFAGPDCAELVGYLQRLLGYALTGLTSESVVPIFYGHGGNGKSVTLRAVSETIGSDYAAPISIAALVAGRSPTGHNADLAAVATKRLVIASEGERGEKMASAVVKLATGGERMSASFKGRQPFVFTPRFTVIFETNFRPAVVGDDEGIWRRLRLVPFANRLDAVEWSKAETEAALAAEAPGILRWLVDGAKAFYSYGLGTPACVLAATAEYRAEEDVLSGFYPGVVVDDAGGFMPQAEVWQLYDVWCARQGIDGFRVRKTLYAALADRGAVRTKRNVAGFRVRLTPEPE
jgi:putative DNA primase/helicase